MILGVIFQLLTFPGVIVHEFAHAIMCRLFGVTIHEVKYFGIYFLKDDNPAGGYVSHGSTKRAWHSILISGAPFFVNTFLGALIAGPSYIAVSRFDGGDLLDKFLVWMGFSIASAAFPSESDAWNAWNAVRRPSTGLLEKVVGIPLVGLLYLGAIGSSLGVAGLVYGYCVAGFLPDLLLPSHP